MLIAMTKQMKQTKQTKQTLQSAGFVLALALLAACERAPDFDSGYPNVLTITQAEFAHTPSVTPPERYERTVRLPDIWSGDNRFDRSPQGWYRITVAPRGLPGSYSVVFVKFTQNIEVYFNGALIGESDPSNTHPVNFNRPFMFRIPFRSSVNALSPHVG